MGGTFPCGGGDICAEATLWRSISEEVGATIRTVSGSATVNFIQVGANILGLNMDASWTLHFGALHSRSIRWIHAFISPTGTAHGCHMGWQQSLVDEVSAEGRCYDVTYHTRYF